jgi:hypothetical protein
MVVETSACRADVVSVRKEVGGEAMSKRMAVDPLGDPDGDRGLLHRPLEPVLMHVMPPGLATARVH